MSPTDLILIGCGVVAYLALIVAGKLIEDRDAWKARSQHWFSVAMGEKPMLNEGQACRLMADLFAPSTTNDVQRQREWRERRAVLSPDHTTRHSIDAATDSEFATELLQFTVGGLEIDE